MTNGRLPVVLGTEQQVNIGRTNIAYWLPYYRLGAKLMNADLCTGFATTKWEELSRRLGTDENAWNEAVGLFERRMRERFFNCIDALAAADTRPDSPSPDLAANAHCVPGFAIIALCCLIIETLQGFREKLPESVHPAGPCTFPAGPCIKPAPGTNQQFVKFLKRPAFNGAFTDKIARRFNFGIRNGILHEAETRKWLIWREQPNGEIVAREGDGYALNRSLFYAAVKTEFQSYLLELRDPANRQLRQRFKEKMGDLCREA